MDESPAPHQPSAAAALSAGSTGHFLASQFASVDTISRATSPGVPFSAKDDDDKKRYRPRTFSYFKLLPFPVEEESQRDAALQGILEQLYIAIKAEDFSPGAVHWTRELSGWLQLKFEMTRELRATLANMYYHLALAPGLNPTTADRFLKMVVFLTRYGLPSTDPLIWGLSGQFANLFARQKTSLPQARRGPHIGLEALMEGDQSPRITF
jgi:proteasome activator subunit 4